MKKEFYEKSLESTADFKSTCCENILSNLYSLLAMAKNCQNYVVKLSRSFFSQLNNLLNDRADCEGSS